MWTNFSQVHKIMLPPRDLAAVGIEVNGAMWTERHRLFTKKNVSDLNEPSIRGNQISVDRRR